MNRKILREIDAIIARKMHRPPFTTATARETTIQTPLELGSSAPDGVVDALAWLMEELARHQEEIGYGYECDDCNDLIAHARAVVGTIVEARDG